MNHTASHIGIVALAALLGACTTTGTGTGETRGGGPGVRFTWTEEGPVKGQMTATFADGRNYVGKMFQITSETRVDDVTPLWVGWYQPWDAWPYWAYGPQFIKHYSGKVVANLSDPSGNRMRCNFRLVDPSRGMAGGGSGKCQFGDGHTIDADFPAV